MKIDLGFFDGVIWKLKSNVFFIIHSV